MACRESGSQERTRRYGGCIFNPSCRGFPEPVKAATEPEPYGDRSLPRLESVLWIGRHHHRNRGDRPSSQLSSQSETISSSVLPGWLLPNCAFKHCPQTAMQAARSGAVLPYSALLDVPLGLPGSVAALSYLQSPSQSAEGQEATSWLLRLPPKA